MSEAKKKPALTTFQIVLTEFAGAFTCGKRDDGKTFYRVKDDAPTWLKGSSVMLAIHSAVDDRLPDDWIYESTAAIASAMTGQYYALERIASAIVEACDEEATTRREAFAERIADIAGQIA